MMEIFGKIFSSGSTGVFDVDGIRTSINKKYQDLLSKSTKIAECGVELVVWSEGATFIFKSDEEASIQHAIQAARDHEIYLGLGLAVLNDSCQNLLANNQSFMENKLILIAPDGSIVWEYLKWNLAPGYERAMTIPGDGQLKVANTVKGSVTGVICYDMDFPQYIRQSGSLKSDLLLAPSNDWPEIKNTHAKMARLRAIENGVSLLRPTSSGLSIAVDPYGKTLSCVDDFQGNGNPFVAVLPMGSVRTLYTTVGDFWTWVCVFGGCILIVLGMTSVIKKKYRSDLAT
jgi:apolipoprotein N-acyltransferase